MAEFFGQFRDGAKPLYVAGFEAIREYREGLKVRTKAPKVRLVLSPFIPPFIPIEILSADFGGLIQSASWRKSRSQSHGTFSVTLAADDNYNTGIRMGGTFHETWKLMGGSLKDIFRPMALAQLWVDGYHVMTGYLRGLRTNTESGPPPSRMYTAQFDELGALYQQNILKDYLIAMGEEINIINNPTRALSIGGSQSGFYPLQLALNFLTNAFWASTLAYGMKGFPRPYLSGSDAIPLAFRMVAQPAPLGCISNNSLWAQTVSNVSMFMNAGSSFWDFLKGICPEPFMELFTESGGRTICTGRLVPKAGPQMTQFAIAGATASFKIPGINITPMLPGFNYLVVRTCPYDNPLIGFSPWAFRIYPYMLSVFDLFLTGDFVIVTDVDVFSKDLGVSDAQQYTVFDVNMNGRNASSGTANGSMNRPSIASGPLIPFFPGGIRTYGVRLMETAVDATAFDWGGTVFQSIQRFARKMGSGANIHALSTVLNTWFRNAAKFNEGTIETRCMPYARPGMVLLYLPTAVGKEMEDPRDIGIYYIDNIEGHWSRNAVDTMSFSVIRGVPLPNTVANLATLLMEWEVLPPGLNIWDGEVY